MSTNSGDKNLIFSLTEENIKFLRIFQILGFLPCKLKKDEGNFAHYSRVILIIFLALFVAIRWWLIHSDLVLVILFLWDILTLFSGQIYSVSIKTRQTEILRLIGEIDERIEHKLHMGNDLRKSNVKMQRKIALIWTFYALFMLYYPVSRILENDFSMLFIDSIFRLITWSFLVHINLTKFLYFFSLLSVRLEVIKNCLVDIQSGFLFPNNFYIKDFVRSKFAENYSIYTRIMTLKEIYYRCWLIQENALIVSGLFLLIYFFGYIGQIIYILFFFMKQAILNGQFMERLFDNALWLALLNVFTITFFIASHKIYSKGLKISGLIHQIAHNGIKDNQLVQAVKLFSMQIQQQPMTHINIFGIFYYDRSNINGVNISVIASLKYFYCFKFPDNSSLHIAFL